MKIALEPVEFNEDPKDISDHNLKLTDKLLNLQLVIYSGFGWLKSRDNSDFSHLEKFLRDNELQTHLIAIDAQKKYNFSLIHPDGQTPCKYECIFSCRPKPHAMEELLERSGSYEDNFKKLKETGSRTLASLSPNGLRKNEVMKIFSEREKSLAEKIINNEVKLTLIN